jgi:hypothetical protein
MIAALSLLLTLAAAPRVPVIDVTDLYHPHQDIGDNVDILTAYSLPEIDLRAVILDVTERFRRPDAPDHGGPREAGYIPMLQLNTIFGRNVPFAAGPSRAMRAPDDAMADLPRAELFGVDLLLETLRRSSERVHILSFGSARAIAVAYNREPQLLRDKVAAIHLSAGDSAGKFLEWNVDLDPQAIIALLRSDLPIALYPCATEAGPFAYGRHNGFWRLENLNFIGDMTPRLQAYLAYAFERTNRLDFLRALDEPVSPQRQAGICRQGHNVWETCVWINVSGRKLVRRADGHCAIVPPAEVGPGDQLLPNDLNPVRTEVDQRGLYRCTPVEGASRRWLYDRGDPMVNERALREALPALYRGYGRGLQ